MSNEAKKHISSIEIVYAEALLGMAEDDGQLDDMKQQVDELIDVIDEQEDLRKILGGRMLRTEQLAGCIESIFKNNVSDLLYRFIQVVNSKQRLYELPGILQAFVKLYDEKRGIVDVDVFVADSLSPERAQRVAAGIGQALQKQVQLNEHVDEKLIGGLKMRVADRLLDGSVATQLKMLKDKMIASGREASRVNLNDMIG